MAGSMTFANEWYQTNKPPWRVAVATVLIAAVFDGLAKLDDKAAVGLSIIVLIGAFTTKFHGNSVADTAAQLFGAKAPAKPKVRAM